MKSLDEVPLHCILTEVNRSRTDIICRTKWLNSTHIIQTKNCISMFMSQNYLQFIQKSVPYLISKVRFQLPRKLRAMSVTYNNGALKSQNHKDPTWSYCSHVWVDCLSIKIIMSFNFSNSILLHANGKSMINFCSSRNFWISKFQIAKMANPQKQYVLLILFRSRKVKK